MHWFLIALIGPTLYALSNHLDKLILSRYIQEDNSDRWVLTAFSSLFGTLIVPIAFFFDHSVFSVPLAVALWLMGIGMFLMGALFLYYTALQRDEASYVVPFYQTIPVFTYIIGLFVLGETLTPLQLLGGTIILAGTLVLSFEGVFSDLRFKRGVVLPMLGASVLMALNDVFFKVFALETSFWASVFWTYAGAGLAGLALLTLSTRTRVGFLNYLRRNSIPGVTAASTSETFFVTAEVAMHYATLLAPVVLVSLVNALQPAFVLLLGIVLTLFFPRLGQESVSSTALIQKGGALVLLVLGTYLIGG